MIEITEARNDAVATSFAWTILLVCGDPAVSGSAYFAGFPADQVSPISCPDNVAFDSAGNLWISTDGQPGTIGYNDGLFRVGLAGANRGRVDQFLAVPRDAETCGPVIRDEDRMVFVAVQHPGEDGTFASPNSYFPDYTTTNGNGLRWAPAVGRAGLAGLTPSHRGSSRTEAPTGPRRRAGPRRSRPTAAAAPRSWRR